MSDQSRFAPNYHSSRETVFYVFCFLILVLLGVWGWYGFQNYQLNKQIQEIQSIIDTQNVTIERNKKLPGYNKLLLVKQLNDTSEYLPWSEHIPKVIDMLTDIQQVDSNTNDSIELSDFSVSLDKIRLRGKVNNLRILYVTRGNFQSLIDRFLKLDFIKNMSIQNYQKNGSSYEFILNADVDINNKK